MTLCERPTHWFPQNPLSFIFNEKLLIIQAQLHTVHVPYMTGGREGRQRDSGRQGVKVRKKETVTRKMKEKSGWNERKGADVGFAKILCGREERMRPGTCGSRPHPISPHYIISLISITSHASFSPFHLLIEVLHGLGENRERERKREGGGGVSGCKHGPLTH